jgi:hypothetical protein
MDQSEYRDEEEDEGSPDAYWRRRVITLALGLGLLGILAWGFSGGGAKNQPGSSSSLVPATALGTAVPGLPSSSPGRTETPTAPATTVTPLPQPSKAATSPRPSVRPGATATSGGTAAPQQQQQQQSQQQLGPDGQCPPGSVVLSLFTDRPSYVQGEYPQFAVYAVSTYPGSCQFDPGQLQVNVMSEGRIIWDSADCARGNDSHATELARGVPAQADVVWNRTITLPGCQVLAADARDGYYQVQARTNTVSSPVREFKLVG